MSRSNVKELSLGPAKPTLQASQPCASVRAIMATFRLSVCALSLAILASGCTSTRITNITPPRQARNSNGLYPVDVIWNSNQQSIQKDTFEPVVIVGKEKIPMRRTELLSNRWEALIPVPSGSNYIHYQFKFDYSYNRLAGPKMDSKMSQPYLLQIEGK